MYLFRVLQASMFLLSVIMLAQTYARNLRTTLKVGEVCVSGGLSMVIEDNSKLCEKVDRLKRAFLCVLCVVVCYCCFLLLSFCCCCLRVYVCVRVCFGVNST